MAKKKSLGILFIGNSHTYYNDMPIMIKQRAVEAGYDCRIAMIAHGGWYLEQHAKEPDVRFNILYGDFDYVVLQEHAHPFGPEEVFFTAAIALNNWIRKSESTPVIFETWARENEPEEQLHINDIHEQVADKIGALLAPVGQNWWRYKDSWPDIHIYAEDGEHASERGSDFAAKMIWETIRSDLVRKEMQMN